MFSSLSLNSSFCWVSREICCCAVSSSTWKNSTIEATRFYCHVFWKTKSKWSKYLEIVIFTCSRLSSEHALLCSSNLPSIIAVSFCMRAVSTKKLNDVNMMKTGNKAANQSLICLHLKDLPLFLFSLSLSFSVLAINSSFNSSWYLMFKEKRSVIIMIIIQSFI